MAWVWLFLAGALASVPAAEPGPVAFDLHADHADRALRRFSQQASVGMIYSTEIAEGFDCPAVRGTYRPAEALRLLLAGSPLQATWDEGSGSFIVTRRRRLPEVVKRDPAKLAERPRRPPELDLSQSIMMRPFDVTADRDRSYGALASTSITAFNVELEKMPVSAEILDETLMSDASGYGIESMIGAYVAGAGVYGVDGANATANGSELDRLDSRLSIRGLGAPTVLRDGFLPAGGSIASPGFTSNFDIERIEIVNGPQSLLYGFSGAGGAINLVTKRARFDQPSTGSVRFQVNEHGRKQGTLDLAASRSALALRFVASRQELGNRRVFLESALDGLYAQLAWRVGRHTLRLSHSSTSYHGPYQNVTTLTARSTEDDARNGLGLRYLLATHQVGAAAAGGPSGAGAIANGTLTWDNVDSIGGDAYLEHDHSRTHTLAFDSQWSRAVSTQLSVGYSEIRQAKYGNNLVQLLAPNAALNPTGAWAAAPSPVDLLGRTRVKSIRLSSVLAHDLLRGRARSQTTLGADYVEYGNDRVVRTYATADAAGNPQINPDPLAANNGFTLLNRYYVRISEGPRYGIRPGSPGARTISVGGQTYAYVGTNESVASLVSDRNPLGLTGHGSGTRNDNETKTRGLYAANFTSWGEGRIATLLGLRVGTIRARRDDVGTTAAPSVRNVTESSALGFNAGLNYALSDWLRPYVSVSSSTLAPVTVQPDPYGQLPGNSRGVGGEAGVKLTNPSRTVSGSIAYFRVESSDEQFAINNALNSVINPVGLNGSHSTPGRWVSAARESSGVQIAATAEPTANVRLRLSAAAFESVLRSDKSYAQFYNDQFHADPGGGVTYRDGTPVYVLPTEVRVVGAASPGAVPLTLGMLNDARSVYFASPVADSSRISADSGAAVVLRTVDPVHGPILTGATGLPISALQVAPNRDAPPPGAIVVSRAGDLAMGNPRYSLNLTGVHVVTTGLLKGLRYGGTLSKTWDYVAYYYFEGSASALGRRSVFRLPLPLQVDGLLGYEFRVGRYGVSAQVNIRNLFNDYRVVLLPSVTTGYSAPRGQGLDARFNVEPRSVVLSTTVSF